MTHEDHKFTRKRKIYWFSSTRFAIVDHVRAIRNLEEIQQYVWRARTCNYIDLDDERQLKRETISKIRHRRIRWIFSRTSRRATLVCRVPQSCRCPSSGDVPGGLFCFLRLLCVLDDFFLRFQPGTLRRVLCVSRQRSAVKALWRLHCSVKRIEIQSLRKLVTMDGHTASKTRSAPNIA